MPKRAAKAKANNKKVEQATPKKQTPRQKLIDLVKQYRQKLAIGAQYYGKADELLTEIRGKLKPNRRVAMGDGMFVVLVDRFDDQDKIWQPVAMKRFELQIQDASGRAVRMRDRKKK